MCVAVLLSCLIFASCWSESIVIQKGYGFVVTWENRLLNHNVFKDWKKIFNEVDLFLSMYETWHLVICSWVSFMKDWKDVTNLVLQNEQKVINENNGWGIVDLQIAKECTLYLWTEKINSIEDVIVHSFTWEDEHRKKIKELHEFISNNK